MRERPQVDLIEALRSLGYRVDSANGRLPATVHGAGKRAGKCRVSIERSSQFASALLLCAGTAGWTVDVEGENSEESSYVAMTRKLVESFPKGGGEFQVEPDASSGSYFLAAGHLLPGARSGSKPAVEVAHWPHAGWQVDERFERVLRSSGLSSYLEADAFRTADAAVAIPAISRQRDLGDSIMMAVVLAAVACRPFRFTNLGRLRVQECERVAALRTELTRCGAAVVEEGDTLTLRPSELHGAEIETYNDHRMAMCFAILGLKISGIQIKNPSCVKKTFPNFFQKLSAPPPAGLGVRILDPRNGRVLSGDQLFAG
jgi:3-phosphoshikimate 1-carboxyvinyltransferase